MASLRQVKIVRAETDASGTFGKLSTGSFECYTLERPATGEHPCILAGTYKVAWTEGAHPNHPKVYEVTKVEGRTAILIHSANWFMQLLGCIAPGRAICEVEGMYEGAQIKQKGVTSSKDALLGLLTDMEKKDFELTISWADGVKPQGVA